MFLDHRRQKCKKKISSEQLSVNNESETVYMYDANEAGRRLEPDSVQPGRFHQKSLRHKLRGDFASTNSREL